MSRRSKYSPEYLEAWAEVFGAGTFGLRLATTDAALLFAEIAGPSAGSGWCATGENFGPWNARNYLATLRDDLLPAARLVVAARYLAKIQARPHGKDCQTDLARAESALDYAHSSSPKDLSERIERVLGEVSELLYEVSRSAAAEADGRGPVVALAAGGAG